MKKLKNIEDKTDRQPNENKDYQLGLKSIGYKFKKGLSQEAKTEFDKIVDKERSINYLKLYFKGGNNKEYDFINFSPLREIFRKIYYGEILIPAAEKGQDDFDEMNKLLEKYKPRTSSKYNKLKQDLLINAKSVYNGREMIIISFKDKLFPLSDPSNYLHYTEGDSLESDSANEKLSESEDKIPDISTFEQITRLDKFYGSDLINKYFIENSLIKIINKLKGYKKILKHIRGITV